VSSFFILLDRPTPGEFFSVEKRVIPRDAHRKHGCLVEEPGVHVVSAERRLRDIRPTGQGHTP
jgi:hypothetical protein